MSTPQGLSPERVGSATFAAVVTVAILVITSGTGCSGSKALLEAQTARIDSLETLNSALGRELETYRDSIAFYDFIDSGEFDREMRFKEVRINRLTYELAVCLDGGKTIATELVDELFEPASAVLTDQGMERLGLLAERLAEHTATGRVHVEGFSDSTRPTGELAEMFPSNWELSAARAAAVVRYFVEAHGIEEDRLVVISYGATQPIAPNTSRRGRSLNRRIRFSHVPLGE